MGENKVEHKSYARLAKYYDMINSDKDYQKEVEFIEFALEKMSKKKVSSVLDVACGTGSHAEHLKKDFFVIGIDSAKSMLDIARRKVKDVDFFREDMRDFNLDRTFDAVVCLNDSFSYNLTDDEILDTLKCFSKHLDEGGVVIFDFLAVAPKEKTQICSYVDGATEVAKISKWSPIEEDNIAAEFVYLIKFKNKVDFHVDHHKYNMVSLRHVKRLMKKVGFRKINILDGFTAKRYRRGSRSAVFTGILKKKKY